VTAARPPAVAVSAGAALLRLLVRVVQALRRERGDSREARLIDSRVDAFGKALFGAIEGVDWANPDLADPRVRALADLFPVFSASALERLFAAMFAPGAPAVIGRSVVRALAQMRADDNGAFEEFVANHKLADLLARAAPEVAPGFRWAPDSGAFLDQRPRTLSPFVMELWRLIATGVAKTKVDAPLAFPGVPQLPPDGRDKGPPRAAPPISEGRPTSAKEGWAQEGGAERVEALQTVFWPVFMAQRAGEEARDAVLGNPARS
jgi:hypothetical protein